MIFRILPLIFLLQIQVTAQQQFQRLQYPASVNGQQLPYPFAGGINAAQFSTADLNNDGLDDIVVFDRAGGVVMPFLNGGQAGEADYHFAPQYACYFPKLNDYALLRDFNRDGAADIFCAAHQPGAQEIQAYQGYYEDNILKFKPILFHYPGCNTCDPRYIWYPDDIPGFWNNLAVSRADIPDFNDIDGDGDMDILTFEASVGGHIWYFKNISAEEGFGPDSLHFRLVNQCWGGFFESGLEPCINCLAAAPGECCQGFNGGGPEPEKQRHPGSTLFTYDDDGDGDMEILLGDISFPCINQMNNGGSKLEAWMDQEDNAFPSYDFSIDIITFPAAFVLDLNNDGRTDLVASPNNRTIGEDQQCVWMYRNTAANGHYFELETKRFLVGDMIDLGTVTHPAFADVNADGLQDLVVGTSGFFTFGNPNNARLYLFLNTGSAQEPAFTLVDSDWLGMSEFVPDDFDFAPAFGDLDTDGDLDLLVGSSAGGLYCYYNTAGAGNPMQFVRDFNTMWLSMDVGLSSTPVIIDLDGDGRKDVVMGERNGNVNFFKNTGSLTEPVFANSPTIQMLGAANSITPNETVGFSAPAFIPAANGLAMVLGAQGGIFKYYENASASADPFTLVTENWGGLHEGNRSHAAFADLDGDGILEMAVGNYRGGLTMYKTVLTDCGVVSSTEAPQQADRRLQIWPNPAGGLVTIFTEAGTTASNWRVFDATGALQAEGSSGGDSFQLDTFGWSPGWYYIQVIDERNGKTKGGKLMIGR